MEKVFTTIEYNLPIRKEIKPNAYPQECESCHQELIKGRIRYAIPSGAYQNRLKFDYLCERCFGIVIHNLSTGAIDNS